MITSGWNFWDESLECSGAFNSIKSTACVVNAIGACTVGGQEASILVRYAYEGVADKLYG